MTFCLNERYYESEYFMAWNALIPVYRKTRGEIQGFAT